MRVYTYIAILVLLTSYNMHFLNKYWIPRNEAVKYFEKMYVNYFSNDLEINFSNNKVQLSPNFIKAFAELLKKLDYKNESDALQAKYKKAMKIMHDDTKGNTKQNTTKQ